jgi:hypothetical protein
MLLVTYYGCLSDPPIKEYILLNHSGYAQTKAYSNLFKLCGNDPAVVKQLNEAQDRESMTFDLGKVAMIMRNLAPPVQISYTLEGRFYTVADHYFRLPEPDFLLEWRSKGEVILDAPQCCHTCYSYNKQGICTHYGNRPPKSFVYNGSRNCPSFCEDIPF